MLSEQQEGQIDEPSDTTCYYCKTTSCKQKIWTYSENCFIFGFQWIGNEHKFFHQNKHVQGHSQWWQGSILSETSILKCTRTTMGNVELFKTKQEGIGQTETSMQVVDETAEVAEVLFTVCSTSKLELFELLMTHPLLFGCQTVQIMLSGTKQRKKKNPVEQLCQM